jgi:hypothetical protein
MTNKYIDENISDIITKIEEILINKKIKVLSKSKYEIVCSVPKNKNLESIFKKESDILENITIYQTGDKTYIRQNYV